MKKPMRRYTFRPYVSGHPHFTLTTWETDTRDSRGCYYIRYCLAMMHNGRRVVLFEGSDFNAGPMHAVDSIGAAEGLMGFLTLRPGDTDADYFKGYTEAQRDFCSQHAESLSAEVSRLWCDPETGSLKEKYR